MPRLPPTPHSMEANEPCLGRWVHDDASGLDGLVIEVKTGGWRVVLGVERYDDDGDATMTAMPPPHSSETKHRRRPPTSSFLGDDAPTAAQEARDLAEALRRSREDAAAAPAPAPAEPSPTPFTGHALLQGFMQA